jgi:hypothetical protein
MAIETENPFEADVTGLNVVGVKPGAFDKALELESQRKIAKLTQPSIETEVPEMKLPTEAQISVKRDPLELQTFDLLGQIEEDAESEVGQLGFDVSLRSESGIPDFKTTLTDYQKDLTKKPTIESIGISGKKTAEEAAEDALKPDIPYFSEPDLGPLQTKGEQYLRDVYQKYFGTPSPTGQWVGTGYGSLAPGAQAAPPPTKPTSFAGTGYGALAPSATGWTGTGYGALAPGAHVLGTSSVAAAAQAGRAASLGMGLKGYGTGAMAGTGTGAGVSSVSAGMTAASQLASVWSIYQGVKAGGEGYVDAAMAASVLLTGGATAIPVAIISGLKALFGMGRRGKQKFAFGGTEFKTEGNKLKFKHPYGYNNFNGGVARAGAASVADYVNTFVNHFSDYTGQGLQFNSKAYAKAIQDDPRLNRYDTMNDSGYADPSVLIRKLFETPGIITGTPYKNGVPITGQEQYQQAMTEFNQWYSKTAKDRGGLVNAQWLNTEEEPNMFKEGWAGQYGEVPDSILHRQRGIIIGFEGIGGNVGGRTIYEWKESREQVESPYDTLYYNLIGKFNRGHGGMGY